RPGRLRLRPRSGAAPGTLTRVRFRGPLAPPHEPVLLRGGLDRPRTLTAPQFGLPADIDSRRLDARRGLAARLDAWQARIERRGGVLDTYDAHHQRAFTLLTSARAKRAFDVGLEPVAVRDRYGNDINGHSGLLARRLVEAGVPFVCVHWIGRIVGAGLSWDTHSDNFGQLKNVLLPAFDACYSALLEDLAQRGLLDSTLVL